MDLLRHIEKYRYIDDLPELPNHIIFEDGNIFSKACNRFLTFSQTSKKGKTYYKLCLTDNVYGVHSFVLRLRCVG